jgi:hypothetical protein
MTKLKNLAYAGLAVLPNPSLPVTGSPVTLAEIQDRITQIAQFLIVISLVIAVIYIVWGGIRWMMSKEDPGKSKAAKEQIKNGIFGAAIILAVGVILQTLAGLVTRTFFG